MLRRFIALPTMVVREVSFDRRFLQLLPEQVDFVQEQDNRLVLEPIAVDKTFKEHKGFVHLNCVHVFEQRLIIAGQRSQEEQAVDTFEVATGY